MWDRQWKRRAGEAPRSGNDEKLLAEVGRAIADAPLPADAVARVEARVRAAIDARPVRGSTRYREDAPSRRLPRAWLMGATAAAAALVTALVVVPAIDAPTELSAAEVLGRSLATLSNVTGVEFLEYELDFEGPAAANLGRGRYTIRQIFDYQSDPPRFRVARLAPDGTLLNAIAEDPVARVRSGVMRLDGQRYFGHFTLPPSVKFSAPGLARRHVEALITMMQMTADQRLAVTDGPEGRQYVITLPRVESGTPAAMWDLSQAEARIAADDFHIVALAASGAYMREPVSFSFRLIRREIRPASSVDPSEFTIAEEPGDIVLQGEGTESPMHDVVVAALRELRNHH